VRNIVFGVIGVLWGGAILLQGLPQANNAYGAGRFAAFAFGLIMLGAGAWALRSGIRSRRAA
jgi:hypothetical protein